MHLLTLSVILSTAPAPVAEAKAALAPFQRALKETLVQAMEKGPEAAIEVCSTRAPQLAKEASTARVTVGRSALKLRNAKNAPPGWLKPLMEELSREAPGAQTQRTVKLPGGGTGYAEPIWTGALCVTCHGATLTPAIEEKLKQAYPGDAARGFELNSFRGVFWAEVKPEPRKSP